MNDTYLYPYSSAEARERNELSLWRESHKANIACRNAIEDTIRQNFDGMHLNKDCLTPVLEEYSYKRTAWVLANTLHELKWDGRFGHANKQWAERTCIPKDINHNSDFVVRSHPAVLDGFVSFYRKAVQALNLFGAEHCVGDRAKQDFTGKVLVLSPDVLREQYWGQKYQLLYDNAENWQALVNASICDIAKAYKIRPENLRWYAAFHQKPNQVHIHMIIFSADPKEGYLTKEGIREMKSVFARRIYHADRMHIYQQKDTARQELQAQTRKAMVECIAQLEHGTSDNPRLEQLTEELAERLLTIKGRKVYGYLPPRVKAIVDAIVEELAKDERVSAAYETWQTLYEQVCLDYDQRPPKRLPLSQQKEFRSVRNMVIQETLQWIAERQQYADAQKSSAMLTESISPENSAPTTRAKVEFTASAVPAQPQAQNTPAPSTEDTGSSDAATSKDAAPPVGEMTPTHSQPSGQAGQTALAGADYRAPTVGETVVRMLHHMSRIFEDNSKIDQIHRGLQIDRKRRQELQRKRLAMGHKPDDHEEQTFR